MHFLLMLILGLFYGLCEFFPISGCGIFYLIYSLSPSSLPTEDASLLFCFLNFGVLFSVVVYFTLNAPFVPEPEIGKRRRRKKTGNLLQNIPARVRPYFVLSLLPLFLVFFRIRSVLAVEKGHLLGVSIAFLLSGIALLASLRFSRGGKNISSLKTKEALVVGAGQLLSVFPGLSRVVSTLTCGLYCGLDYAFTLDYASLISVPAYLAAAALLFVRATELGLNWALVPGCFGAMLVSGLGGYCSIHLMKKVFRPENNRVFALISLGLGALTFVLSMIR